MPEKRTWLPLDNAAKIYPAAKRRNWTALFRVSATLTENVDPLILQSALESTLKRIPTFGVRLRRGLFWFYLEKIDEKPVLQHDVINPCVRMNLKENHGYMFRVRYFENRIALEVFHALADGTGGITFLKTLVAEYLSMKYGVQIPRDDSILDCAAEPKADESEDAYRKYARSVTRSRNESTSYYLKGTDMKSTEIRVITGIIPTSEVLERAREKGVTLTEFLTAVLILSVDDLQRLSGRRRSRMKPEKVCVPINLRKYYPTHTLRNFASYVNPGIDPRYGDYTLYEVIQIVHHTMGLELTEKMLNAKFTTNIRSEEMKILRIMPLPVKNVAMRLTFQIQGDRQSTTSLSNLGQVKLPPEMAQYVSRMDFMLGPLWRNRVVFASLSYQDQLIINCTGKIKETALERAFFHRLVQLGIHVKIESNGYGTEEY